MRVLIGEDEALMREGLVLVLEQAGIEVVGVAADAEALMRQVADLSPDLVLTDIRMPPGLADDGLRAALWIRAERADAAVVVLSQHVQRRYALDLIGERPEGVGYLLKQRIVDADEFVRDLRRVNDGGTVLDPEVVSAMLARARRDDGALERLTPRQAQVLGLIAEGRSNAAIAGRLTITEKAVVQHTSRIYDELGLAPSDQDHRRVLAVVRYLSRT